MFTRLRAAALVAAAMVIAAPVAQSAYQDVLDTPAKKSAIAARQMLVDMAWAGPRLVGVGPRGLILTSDDSGKSWSQATVPVSSDLVAVYFPTARKGWAVGHDGVVLHSSDGGISWVKQLDGRAAGKLLLAHLSDPAKLGVDPALADKLKQEAQRFAEQGPDKPFLDVWFADETTGFIVGAFNLIFRTTDGGKNWEPWFERTDNPNFFHFYAVRKIGNDLYLAGEQGLVLKLDAQGGRFRALPIGYKGTFFGILGTSSVVVVFGLRGNVFASRDGGATWRKVDTGTVESIVGGCALPDGRVVLAGQLGILLISADAAASFAAAKGGKPASTTGVLPLGKDSVVLSGMQGVRVQSLE